jgi:hypothetical protein
MNLKQTLILIAGVIATIGIGIYAGNQALIQSNLDQANQINDLKVSVRNCSTSTGGTNTDLTSIQRAFQRCFNNFNPSGQAKTCINYMRFKDCINTAMGRFK